MSQTSLSHDNTTKSDAIINNQGGGGGVRKRHGNG